MPAIATRPDGRTVRELDGRPAEDVYLEARARGTSLDDRAFEAVAVLHPLAQPELRGDVRLRHVIGRADGGGLAARRTSRRTPRCGSPSRPQDSIVRSAATRCTRRSPGSAARRPARRWSSTAPRASARWVTALAEEASTLSSSFGDIRRRSRGSTRAARSAGSAARREIATMPSSSSPSADARRRRRRPMRPALRGGVAAGGDHRAGQRGAARPGARARRYAELCEAFEAELAFLVVTRADGARASASAAQASRPSRRPGASTSPLCVRHWVARRAVQPARTLLGLGAREVRLAPFAYGRAATGHASAWRACTTSPSTPPSSRCWRPSRAASATRSSAPGWAPERDRHAAPPGRARPRRQGAVGRPSSATRCSTRSPPRWRGPGRGRRGRVLRGCGRRARAPSPRTGCRHRRRPAALAGRGARRRASCAPARRSSRTRTGGAPRRPAPPATLDGVRSALSAPLRRHGAVDGAVSAGFDDRPLDRRKRTSSC